MHIYTLKELQQKAKEILPIDIYDFIAGGAGYEYGLENNFKAFTRYEIVPRVLQKVGPITTKVKILNQYYCSPIIVGPSSFHQLVNDAGEIATAKAANQAKMLMVLSTMSSYSLEAVAEVSNQDKWFQLYVTKNKKITEDLIKRAENNNYSALVITVDVPVMGARWKDFRNHFSLPEKISAANFGWNNSIELSKKISGSKIKYFTDEQFEPELSWELIDWIASITSLPIILKGLLHPLDASEALNHRIAGIIVSNHGGRQIDSVISSVEALPDIYKIVNNKIPLFLDGSISSGEDIFKAISLGATAVLIARPVLWGLAVDGEQGVTWVLEKLQQELELIMRLAGVRNIEEIKQNGSFCITKRDCF